MFDISSVVTADLCVGCGVCAGVCPNHAIEMHTSKGLSLPKIDEGKCSKCRICVQSCPGYSVNFQVLNDGVFGKQPEDRLLGNFLECHLGRSNDDEVTAVASSGGILDQMLIYMLEKGLIDGVALARMKEGKPTEPEVFVARTREQVLSGAGSKYCPVSPGVVLERLLSERGRFAVVGLPCHIHGFRKAEEIFPQLKSRIVLHVGLFCGHTVSFEGTNFLLEKFRVRMEDVVRLNYRGNGCPDSMHIHLKDNSKLTVRFNRGWDAYWNVFSPFFFTPQRCMMCPDQFNELADVSFGDAWLPELRSRRTRESVVIVRTDAAKKILAVLRGSGLLSLRVIPPDKVRESQAFSLNYKKKQLHGRLSLMRKLGRTTPKFVPEPSCTRYIGFVGALLSLASLKASSQNRFKSLLVHVPLPLFRLYFGFFKVVFLLSRSVSIGA